VRTQLASAFDLIVQVNRLADGSRRLTHLTEVAGMERETVALRDLLLFDHQSGRHVTTGHRPAFLERFAHKGVTIPEALLG
jgi:pilus assembly protein CpaF